jgi:AraC family transcriptional regulator
VSTMGITTSRPIFEGHRIKIGQFVCPTTAPNFTDTGPIRYGPIIVFPRIGVEITHAGHAPILADPNTVIFYNEGQEYRRGKVSPYGDRCEWFAFDPTLVREVVSQFDPSVNDQERNLFGITHATSTAQLYLHQRVVVEHLLNQAHPNHLFVEETALNLLEQVVANAYTSHGYRPHRNSDTVRIHADLVHAAKGMIATRFHETLTLDDIAGGLYVSPYHLCRVFRQQTGNTLHHYLTQIRLRASLESIADRNQEVTAIALGLGFSSHSHFTSAFRHTFGMPPSTYQRTTTQFLPNFSNNLIA